MRILTCTLSLMLSALAGSQEDEKWRRIYTFEDAALEMNVSKVSFGTGKIGRVRFRTVLSKPEALKEMSGVKYKSRLETIEFKCAERQYRVYETSLLDPKGKAIKSFEMGMSEEWKAVKSGSMAGRMYAPACKLIDEKRRNPGEESQL